MKGLIVVAILLVLWLAYTRDSTFSSLTNPRKPQSGNAGRNGVSGTLNPYYHRATNLSTNGGTSPGSGVPARQPQLISSWAHGSSGVGMGYVGINAAKQRRKA